MKPMGTGRESPRRHATAHDHRGEVLPFALTFASGGGHHGTLSTDAGTFRIDLAEASIGHCCHHTKWHGLLVQRVADDG